MERWIKRSRPLKWKHVTGTSRRQLDTFALDGAMIGVVEKVSLFREHLVFCSLLLSYQAKHIFVLWKLEVRQHEKKEAELGFDWTLRRGNETKLQT